MRSRSVSVSIILQNLAQLKALFEKQWESIVGNCDEFLYLRAVTSKVPINMFLNFYGKETIDLDTHGKSSGRSGNYSTNYQIAGRELMTPDEVRLLDNKYALLFIRGERPIKDFKYDILKHPNIDLTTDGKSKPYVHGRTDRATATVIVLDEESEEYKIDNIEKQELLENYELLSDEELEQIIREVS